MADAAAVLVLDVSVEDEAWRALADAPALAERAAHAAFDGAAAAGPAEAAVILSTDARVRILNRDYRGKDKPTNVLSFAVGDEGTALPEGALRLLGDIVVAFETLRREADEEGKSLSDHFSHLVVHGMLHLLGYDHLDDAQADEMESLEARVLAGLGIADPYAA